VTGANGNAGWNVVRGLLRLFGEEQEVFLRVCVRGSKRDGFLKRLEESGVEVREGRLEFAELDFWSPETFEEVLQGCDGVFLLRPPAIAKTKKTLVPFIDSAYKVGVQRIVFLSVDGAENKPWVPHHAVEKHLQQSQSWWAILRPGFFAQNLEDAYRRDIKEDGRLIAPSGKARVNFVDMLDLGEITAILLTSPDQPASQALTLTGPGSVSFDDVAEILTDKLGKKIRYQSVSIFRYMWHLMVYRKRSFMHAIIQTFLHFRLRFGDGETITSTVSDILNRPPTSIAEYIERRKSCWVN